MLECQGVRNTVVDAPALNETKGLLRGWQPYFRRQSHLFDGFQMISNRLILIISFCDNPESLLEGNPKQLVVCQIKLFYSIFTTGFTNSHFCAKTVSVHFRASFCGVSTHIRLQLNFGIFNRQFVFVSFGFANSGQFLAIDFNLEPLHRSDSGCTRVWEVFGSKAHMVFRVVWITICWCMMFIFCCIHIV